ncbi:hypothetical protein [Clostridioides difficile]|uniref:hypothetical protein n=1 Tax=Clostridioides difficile TaxID=1496 RepID=UPI0010334FB2|nr:hypothetical protein [Clostridioides difficile]MDM9943969.1 hypothetical protein [Clostridioides difficile]
MSVHLKDLFGLESKQIVIQSTSELLLICELDKYLQSMTRERLDLEEVTVLPELRKGNFFTFVMNKGLAFNYEYEMKSYSKIRPFLFLDTITDDKIFFSEYTDERVVYDFDSKPETNRIFHGANKDHAYISIVAYIYVKSFINNKKFPKIILGNENYHFMFKEYSHIIILHRYGNKFIKDIEWKGVCKETNTNEENNSYVIYRRQLGHMNRPYTIQEKYNYIINNYEVGDVILYYKRNCKKQKYSKYISDDKIPNVEKCYPAVIRNITKENFTIDYYPLVETKLTRYINLKCIKNNNSWSEGLSHKDYNLYPSAQEVFSYVSFGIDDLTYDEETMFLKLVESDGAFQWIKKGDNFVNTWFPTIDAIYAVFEDRGVEYNKEKFLKIYYDNNTKKPLYDLLNENNI